MKDAGTQISINIGAATVRDHVSREAALEDMYDAYAPSLYRYALSILGSPDDAEDAVQEVFIRLARECGRLRGIRNIRAYLLTATRHAAYSILRARCRGDSLTEALLRRSWQPEPPEGMRERVLRRSRQEIARRSGKRPIWSFVRRGPVFAAIALAIVLLANISDYYRQDRLCAMTQCADAGPIPGDLLRQRRDMEKLLVQGISDHRAVEEGGMRL